MNIQEAIAVFDAAEAESLPLGLDRKVTVRWED